MSYMKREGPQYVEVGRIVSLHRVRGVTITDAGAVE
jgi:hypothetical protein